MKTIKIGMLAMAMAVLGASAATTTTKTVTWSLPEGWDAEVSYPEVQGYRAIVGPNLLDRTGLGKVAEPDLPYMRIRVALPSNGTFGDVKAEAEWSPVNLGSALPMPIPQPVPSGDDIVYPTPGAAYATSYPSAIAKAEYLQIANGVRMMPICVTPYRWDGATKTLYKATKLTVTATYTVPKSLLRLTTSSASSSKSTAGHPDLRKMALSMTINPDDATTASSGLRLTTSSTSDYPYPAAEGDDRTADFIIISPHDFVDLWKQFVAYRKTTVLGQSHTFAIKDADDIYEEFESDADDQLRIHHYLERIYALGKIKYVLLGAAPVKYNYNPKTMIPTRTIVSGGSLAQIADMYYGCMDRMPVGVGVEVWDYDGDGAYLGHKNSNGSYSCDSNDKIDWVQDIIVYRFPLMERVVDTGYELTAQQIMDNFIERIKYSEGADFPGKYNYNLNGSTAFRTSTKESPNSSLYSVVVDEREFFDGLVNHFDPSHGSNISDSEMFPRDRHFQLLTYLRGNRDYYSYNSSQSNISWAEMYSKNADVMHVHAHGWARGCSPGNGPEAFTSSGHCRIWNNAGPCDSGMMDYCPGGSYGITNCICFGEAPILAKNPHGGGLASMNNTRLGWFGGSGFQGTSGEGSFSSRMEWLIFKAMSGVAEYEAGNGYRMMDAGEALMWAKNNYGWHSSSTAWFLAGLEVTGQGDPLAKLTEQECRVWNGQAGNYNWSTNDANWSIPGRNGSHVLDVSRDLYASVKDAEGDVTFTIDEDFTSAGLFVEQKAGATLTLAGEGSYKSLRETVITNGNVRWEVAGGAGRNGIKFVGASGNLLLPGNNKRYFGERFSNVGTISVSGGNVVIDTPRNASFSAGSLGYDEIEFVAADRADVTEWNQLRSRNAGIFKTSPEKHLRVVNSKLILQTYNIGGSGSGNKDKSLIYATNSVIKVQANPRYLEEYFVRPTHLHNSEIVGDYSQFAFGPSDSKGYDLYVSGKSVISGDVPIKLNGELRIHFEDATSELVISNSFCNGTTTGTITFVGAGKAVFAAPQTFGGTINVPDGVTVETTVADAFGQPVVVKGGGTLTLGTIPLTGLPSLTVEANGSLKLPGETYMGTYKIVDVTTTTLDLQEDSKIYDGDTLIEGELRQGHYILTANVLTWRASGETWNKNSDNTTAWENSEQQGVAYTDNTPLAFGDLGSSEVQVNVGENVRPGFVDFRNSSSRYVFSAATGTTPEIAFNSLVLDKPATFDVKVTSPSGLAATGSEVQFADIVAPKVEVASGGYLRATGTVDIASQKVKRLKFIFTATRESGNAPAVQELRLFRNGEIAQLPVNTVVRDIAGQSVTVTGYASNYGHTMAGNINDEDLGAMFDGKVSAGGNKWWPSRCSMPCWFEIEFPTLQDPFDGYAFCNADQMARDPKDWTVYASPDDDGRYSPVSVVTGAQYNGRRWWMIGNGSATGDQWQFSQMTGLVSVMSGGTLVLDGTWNSELDLRDGSVLAVTNKCALKAGSGYKVLTMPSDGTVTVDFARAAASSESFPVLTGFGITAEQFGKFVCGTETAMLLLKDGDIYVATENVMVPPYTATVSSDTTWNNIQWKDKNNNSFTWTTAHIKADGTATITVSGTRSVAMDAVGTIAKLTVNGTGSISFNKVDNVTPIVPATLDASGISGTLTWNVPIDSTAVVAGSDTVINGGSAGTGKLTVGAGKKVTLGEGVTFANRDINATGWVRFAGERGEMSVSDLPNAVYSFEDTTLTGSFELPNWMIKSAAGDHVQLFGTNDNFNARSLINFAITGGLVEVLPNGESTWFGRTATSGSTAATAFTQSGGIFRCTADGTGTGSGLLVGYTGGTDEGEALTATMTGGLFEVPNSFLNFGNPTVFNLSSGARLKAKGFASSMSKGTVTLGTGASATDSATLEIGALGFQKGAATLTMRTATEIVGFEQGAYLSENVILYGYRRSTSDAMTIAATNGAQLILRDMAFESYTVDGEVYNGSEAVVFGKKAKDYTGEVVIESEACLPKSWTVNAGSVNVGKVRAYVASTLTAQPTEGTVIAIITQDEFNSGASSEILHCGDWANALTSEQLRSFIVVKIEQADGSLVVDTTGKLRCSNGIVEFIPAGAAGYLFPVSASVTADADWTKLDWYDRNGIKYTNDWQGVVSAELVSSNGDFAVTMDKSISMKRLTTRVTSGKTLTLNAGDGKTLALTDKLDDSASVGTTILHIALGEGMTVSAGKSLKIDGASNSSVAHGKLIIGPNSQVTVVDGHWNGEVEMSDTTSKLRYESTVTLDAIPSALNATDVGLIEYAAPMVPANGVASFGSSSGRGVSGTYYFRDGTSITANEFLTGVGNGTSQQFRHYAGTVTVNDGGDIVIGEGTGSEVSYYLWGGDIIAPDSMIKLGKGGQSQFNNRSSKSVCRVKGLTTSDVDNNSSVTFLDSCIDIGSGGIDIDSSVHDENVVFYPMNMMPGTISSHEDTRVDIPNGIGVYLTLTLAPSNSTVMTVNAPINRSWLTAKVQATGALVINADGRVDLESENNLNGTTTLTAGTLRLKQKGLLKTSKVMFGNGDIEVLISEAEARTASTYTLFTTDAALNTFQNKVRVLVEGTENVVAGTLAKSGINVTFKPTILDGISVTISADKTCDWTAVGWTYSNGTAVPASAWNSVIGSATLNNSANVTLTFGSNCLISSLAINNTGTLDLTGNGTMSAGSVNASASTGTVKIGPFLEAEVLVAGKDTVISERHDYIITNNTGKLTIPGWTTPSKVSGTGVVALDMGARDTVVGSYWSKDAGITGTNQIVRGTWEFTANSQYPNGKEILVSGTNAVLRIKNSNDITGYSGVSGAITVEDGGEFQVYKRDTFSRTLYLRNGGKLLMNNDNNDNSGRSLDFYSGSTVVVSGQTPSVIGGTEATVDSFGNPTVKSGIIAIRRNNFTINVADGSLLKVYSRWNTADGNSGSFIKTGAGVWEQYRESGSGLPFRVEGGTLRLINSGSVTTAGIYNAGVLEVITSNGCEKTMANTISGSGSLVKNGPGTLTLSAANTYTGATTINSGTVRLGSASATFGSGAVTIAEGVMLDIGTARPSGAMLLNGELTATVKQTEKDGEQWVTLCTLQDGSNFTSDDLTVYDVDGTTELEEIERQIVDGKVQIRCEAYKMPISLKAYNAVEANWTEADWQDGNNTLIPAAKWEGLFGRTNLAVEVYAYNGNAVTLDVDAAADLALFTISGESGKVTLRKTADGYGFASDATVLDGTLQVYDGVNLGAISGGGTLIATNFVPAYAGLADATKWTGTLQLWDVATNALDFASIMNSGSKVVLNGVTVTTGSTIPDSCKVEVTAGTVFKTAGLAVNGELTVTQNATTPIDGSVTFGAAGRLNLTMGTFATSVQIATGDLTMPSSVRLFVNGVERPTGTWTAENGAINLPLKRPFKATVTENAEWTALAWQDSSDTPVAVHPGFWSTSTSADNVELTVNAGATLTAASAITVGTVKVTGSGAVVLPTSNLTMGNLLGDGTIAYAGWPTSITGLTDADGWTGTLKLTGTLAKKENLNFNTLGNASSRIEIAGAMSNGSYVVPGGTCAIPLCVSGTFWLSNGNSNSPNGYTFTGALTGSGTIKVTGGPTDVTKFTGDVSGFTGTVQTTNAGGQCIAFGDQTDDNTTVGKIVVNKDVTIAAGKQWSAANGIVVRDGKTLTMTSGTTPVSGNITFEDASTLKLTDDGTAESYAIATGTLTLSDLTVIKFGDTVASRTEWFAVGGSLVKPTNITATSEGASLAGHDGEPISVTGVSGGYAVVSAAISPSLLLAKGDALTIKYTECGSMTLAGGLVAGSTSVSLDASGMDGTELAKNAVRGAPYSHWLVKGAISGTVDVTNLPTMPTGYKVEKQVLNGYGVRLIIKAPDEAMFGAVSVNVRNGAALESTDTLSGLYPVARKYWGDLQASAGKSVTVSNVTATIGTSASAYGLSNDPSDMILKQYMDDSVGVTRTITVAGITYPKYRVIVYFSTDSTTINFRPAVINGVSYSATPAGTTSAAHSISGATGDWGNTGPNHNAYDLCEGVNALISDVMTAGTATIAATRISNPGSRATIAAIQIVKVGEIAVPTTPDEPFILTIAGAAGSVDWKSAAWIGDNEVAVPSTAWESAVGEAKIVVAEGGSATVNAVSLVSVGSLKVVNAGTLAVSGSLSMTTLDDSESTGATTAGGTIANVTAGTNTLITSFTGTATIADGKKLTVTDGTYNDSQFAITGTGALNVAGGTMDAPVVVNDSASKLNSKTITIAASSVLKTAITDNRTYLITGAGATSKLIVAGTKDVGLYEGTQLRNLTLVVDSPSYNTWIEHRNSGETDATVDVEILNSSPVVIGGGVVPIGSLAGNGNLSINGSSSLDIHMDRSATTYSGASAVPMTVSGSYPLTLTGANTCALTVNAGATVILSDGGTVGSATGAGTVTVNAGTLNVAVGSTLALAFADNTTLNLTGTLTAGGTFPFASSVTGKPTVTLNGGALPSYCKIEGNNLVVTPEQKSWNNPVTGDAVNFSYAFFGTSDANWTTIGNWREYGTISWNTMTGTAPMLSGSGRWNPAVIDGSLIADASRKTITLSGTNMEGWTPRLALFNGVNVTIGNMTKLQSNNNGEKWIWVDETSKLTFTQIASGNFSHDFKLYVAGEDGITFTQAIPKDGTTFEYYLSTNGTVKYEEALTKCSHTIKQFCLTMDKPSAYKVIKERTLVTYPSTTKDFTTSDITVPTIGDITPTNLGREPTTADAFGAYGVVKGDTALVVKYVDYSQFYTNLADNAEIAVSTINALAATAGSEPYYVAFGKGVTMEFDAEFASNVVFDFTKMTADSTFVKTGEDEFAWSNAFQAFMGTFDIREGVMTIPTNTLANAITVASAATLNLTGTLGEDDVTITTGTFVNNGTVLVNGQPIPADREIKDGKIVKIQWVYPLIYTIAGDFTTTGAQWKDSAVPSRIYTGGFGHQVDELYVSGAEEQSDAIEWVNDATCLDTTNLVFQYVYFFEMTVRNADGCSIDADRIDGSYEQYNYNYINLKFDTGDATLVPGYNMVLYCNGSGKVELNQVSEYYVPTLTFNPLAGTNLTYSGAITGTGAVIKDGAGTLTYTGSDTHAGGTTVKAGTLRVAPGVLNGAATIEAGATLDVTITGGLVAGQEYAIMGSGTLTVKSGATVTVNGAALPEGWNVQDGKIVYTIPTEPFILTITDAGSVDWSAADWKGSNGITVPAARWSESVGAATINVDGDVAATLVADVAVNVTALTVNSAEELTLDKGSASLTIGTLIVAANKCVSVGDGVTVTTPSVSAGGSIRFLAAAQATSPKVTTAGAIVGYKNASFGAMSDDQWVLKVESGDAVALTKSGTYLAADVRTGGTLTLGSGTQWIYGGKSSSTGALTNSVITVNGGTVTSPITGTGTTTDRGLLIGNSQTSVGIQPRIVMNDGIFDIQNGQITFWEYAKLIMNGGTLKAKGIGQGASHQQGTLDLNGGVIELGETGMRKLTSGAPQFNFNLKGGTLKAVADTSVAAGVTTVAASGTTSTLAAATGKTLTIATTISGAGGITVGTAEATGTVAFTAAPTFTGAIAVNAGTLTLPMGSYANAMTIEEGATLNLTGTLGDELVITTGTFTNHGAVKINGAAIPEGWVLDGNKIRKLATQPFIYIIAGTQGDVNWTDANWVGQNGYAVLPSQWSEADVTAVVQGGAGDSARLVADTALNLSTLTIETAEEIALAKGGDDAFAVATLSVANGYSVALESGVSVTAYDVKAGGHIHFLNETAVTTPTVSTAGAMVSYKNASFTTAPTDYSWILRVEDGDSVAMSSATQFFPIDVRGGTLTLGGATAVGEYIYGGKNGGGANTNSVITVNGGRVVANINGTATSGSSNRGFIYGCTASGITQHPTLTINDGEFDISSGILSPWEFGDLVVNGGVLKAKGICKGGNYGGTFALNGGELQIGEKGMSIRNSAFPMTVGGDAKITSTAAMSISLPTTIEFGNTLTFNAAAGDINAAGANIVNDGTIVVEAGNVNLGTARGDIEAQGADTVITLYETVNDGGKVTIKTENANGVVMKRADGTTAIVTTSKDNGDGTYTFSFTPQFDGKVCWWDYEFDGNVNSVGTDTTGLTAEGTSPYFNSENTAILVGHATHYRGATYPAEFTAVMQCKMVDQQQHVEMGFGSTTGGTKINVALACGNPTKEEVLLIISEGTAAKKTVSMTVPNAYTADHLYAFACKTILDGLVEKTQVNVYLDGQMLDSFTFDSVVTLGGGFQIGSVHGGVPSGCIKATTANANAYLNFLRVYKCELSAAVMKAYAEEYPYVSPNGSYTREVEGGDVTWKTDDDSWQQKGEGGTSTNAPAEKATVELSAADDTTVTMELTKDVTYEAMTLDGEGEVTIVKGDDAEGQVKITGRLTVNTDATIDPAAIDIANTPITVAAGKTLTIDMTDVDLDDVLQTTTYKLTGLVSAGAESEVAVATNAYEEIDGRTVELAPNADQHYELKVEVVPEEVKLALDLDNDSKEVSFSGTDTLDIPLDWTLQLTNTTALTHGNVTKTTVAAALNATNTTSEIVIPNGIKPWESYVLTLSPTNALSVPVIAPIQGTETDKITFALDNVAVRSEVSDKVNVTYKVYSGTTIGAKTEASDSVAAGETIKIDLPESGVKYYHIEVDIAPKP